ncbi:MAG: hypothetical protein GPOALKHO_000132 [Sodalis sp.]|nr:MAG: hypothetical protein GPOALKHO_000132 [Sodalis sp.]
MTLAAGGSIIEKLTPFAGPTEERHTVHLGKWPHVGVSAVSTQRTGDARCESAHEFFVFAIKIFRYSSLKEIVCVKAASDPFGM